MLPNRATFTYDIVPAVTAAALRAWLRRGGVNRKRIGEMTMTKSERAASLAVANAAAETIKRQIQEKAPEMIFTAGQLIVIDKWIAATDPTLDRAEAIRRLVDVGLKGSPG
jgi:hypothetical protein